MHTNQTTLGNVVAYAILAVLLLSLIIPLGSASADRSQAGAHQDQQRGIHQALVTFSHSNRSYFPGLNFSGEHVAIDVEQRYQALLEADLLEPRDLVSPAEFDAGIAPARGQSVTVSNYSHAMLQITESGGRQMEWRSTLNSQAVVLGDRNIGSANSPEGILWAARHAAPDIQYAAMGCTSGDSDEEDAQEDGEGAEAGPPPTGAWAGYVTWNDGHTSLLDGPVTQTKYANGTLSDDHLFIAESDMDGLLIHSGN